jgi:hypothetical protein
MHFVFLQLSFIIFLWMIHLKQEIFKRTLCNIMPQWPSHPWGSTLTVPSLCWAHSFFASMENLNISLDLCYLRQMSILPMHNFIFMTAMLLKISMSLAMATYPSKPYSFSKKSYVTTIHTPIFTSMPIVTNYLFFFSS